MLYPLKFFPVYKNMIWGGRNIEKTFNREVPEGNIGESWEICCRVDGMSMVSNGSFKYRTIEDLVNEYKEELLGDLVYGKSTFNIFPLLIKLIDATDSLSVQVHPNDEYAMKYNDNGKTELWYVIDAKPGAKLIYGLKNGTTRKELVASIGENNIERNLNKIPVKKGDVLYLPSGTVHAMLEGVLIAEIQQNSNITYRLYDWNRVDMNGKSRELHINQALDVIKFDDVNQNILMETANYSSYSKRILTKNDYFTVEELNIHKIYTNSTDGSKFYIYMIIEGDGVVNYQYGVEELLPGNTIFIPAKMGTYNITGNIKVLRIYV